MVLIAYDALHHATNLKNKLVYTFTYHGGNRKLYQNKLFMLTWNIHQHSFTTMFQSNLIIVIKGISVYSMVSITYNHWEIFLMWSYIFKNLCTNVKNSWMNHIKYTYKHVDKDVERKNLPSMSEITFLWILDILAYPIDPLEYSNSLLQYWHFLQRKK